MPAEKKWLFSFNDNTPFFGAVFKNGYIIVNQFTIDDAVFTPGGFWK